MQAPIKNDEEFAQVLDRAMQMRDPNKYRLMILLSVKLMLRPLEMAGMDRSWFRQGELRVPVGYSKRKVGRSIPYSQEIEDALTLYMGTRRGRVFLNRDLRPYTAAGMSDAFRRLYREAQVQGSCYSGRRTGATRMADRGVNIAVISKVLGHSSIATTQNYIGVTDNMMRNAMFA